ncbi:MAG: Glutathione transport system permease protein GsiC [Fimbriimonadaceae bacterium]|nr:Glutathione transport system permease protein GsiC [Fimbriimonadaceae bacterium]
MKLVRSILLRLLYGTLSLLFISLITFAASSLSPGDPAQRIAGEKASPETVQRIRENMGLDRPWPERYVKFIAGATKFDFGQSYYGTKEDVGTIIKRNLPMTLKIAAMAILLAAILGILMGTLAAVYENRFADRSVLVLSTLGVTLPNFVLAPILVYIFYLKLDQLPATWSTTLVVPEIYYLILPVVILAARPTAQLTRLTRASMIETLNQDFIRLAIAKGVPSLRLIFRHALRNAILPVVTAIGTNFGFLLTGSFVVETIFTLPGIGREGILAIQRNDIPMVQATVLLAGAIFILINLLVDIALPVLDPRIREAQV